MKIKLWLGLGLIFFPLMSYAGAGVQYNLKNTSSSTYPINVLAGSVIYYFASKNGQSLPSNCPWDPMQPGRVDLRKIVNLPLTIDSGAESTFTFTMDSSMDNCFINGQSWIVLNITQVDDIHEQEGLCKAATQLTNYVYMNAKMNIKEFGGNLYCDQVDTVKK